MVTNGFRLFALFRFKQVKDEAAKRGLPRPTGLGQLISTDWQSVPEDEKAAYEAHAATPRGQLALKNTRNCFGRTEPHNPQPPSLSESFNANGTVTSGVVPTAARSCSPSPHQLPAATNHLHTANRGAGMMTGGHASCGKPGGRQMVVKQNNRHHPYSSATVSRSSPRHPSYGTAPPVAGPSNMTSTPQSATQLQSGASPATYSDRPVRPLPARIYRQRSLPGLPAVPPPSSELDPPRTVTPQTGASARASPAYHMQVPAQVLSDYRTGSPTADRRTKEMADVDAFHRAILPESSTPPLPEFDLPIDRTPLPHPLHISVHEFYPEDRRYWRNGSRLESGWGAFVRFPLP